MDFCTFPWTPIERRGREKSLFNGPVELQVYDLSVRLGNGKEGMGCPFGLELKRHVTGRQG